MQAQSAPQRSEHAEHHRIVILGSGFSGVGAGVRLKRAGFEDFVILERAGQLGGTWRENTYPGCACDVPSHLYSLSFAPNRGWSHSFSGHAEILDYLRRVARRSDLGPHIRYNQEITGAGWDEQAELWRIEVNGGAAGYTAELFVAAPGPLSEPKLPEIPGIESFQGEMFHSARWNHAHSPRGRRVAVIGTGASAIQFVPQIQPLVERLYLYQRTPPWIFARRNRAISAPLRRLYQALPPAQLAMRGAIFWLEEMLALAFVHPRLGRPFEWMGRRHMESQVADPELRAKLTPSYHVGCKRVLFSDDYYPALCQPNVEVIVDRIEAVTPGGIRTEAGDERELDTIILGTGFHVTDIPMARWVSGAGGHTLADVWQGSPRAYLGMAVAGFPNFLILYGPNTNLGHNSVLFMIEAQLGYLIDCLRQLQRGGVSIFDVRPAVQERYQAELERALRGTVWNTDSGGCHSWYIDRNGHNSSIWPGFTWPYHRRTRHFDPADYLVRARARPLPDGGGLAVADDAGQRGVGRARARARVQAPG